MSLEIVWLGHASVMIRYGSGVLYVDPWKVDRSLPGADIVLLTHDHYDHYSPDDLAFLAGETTRVVAPMEAPEVTDRIRPGERLVLGEVTVEAVPAYNIGKPFHPRENGWLGYVVEIYGKRIYHAGDTDRIPEMAGLEVDVAMVPVGGTYTMDYREAARAVADIQARAAVPIHFGDIVGSAQDAQSFAGSCACPVHILEPGGSLTVA